MTNEEFAKLLVAGIADDACATIHSFTGDPNKATRWGAIPWHPGKPFPTLNPFANNYICVSSFTKASDGKFHRRKIQFKALHAVMIDDLGTKLPMEDLKLEPSALVETSPGNFQAWLFLDVPILSLPHAEALIDAMIEGGISAELDPGMKGVTRVARLPFGCNGKPKYRDERGHAWTQRLVSSSPVRYSPRAIAEAYNLADIEPRKPRSVASKPRAGIDPERAGLLKWIKLFGLHVDEQREQYHNIVCPWADQHSDGGKTGTYYMEPLSTNAWMGGFVCNHGHCMERDINDLVGWVRARRDDVLADKKIPQFIEQWVESNDRHSRSGN